MVSDAYVAYVEALKRKGASPNTLRLNRQNWRLRLSKHQGREITSITRADVRSWHATWGKSGHATSSCSVSTEAKQVELVIFLVKNDLRHVF